MVTRITAVVLLAALASCGSGPARCVPNASQSCVCADGQGGVQVCRADGTFSPCTVTGAVCAADVTGRDAGVLVGMVDFDVRFRPTGAPRAVDCQTAALTNIRFDFFDQALDNLLRTQVTRPCVPTERYRVSIDVGPYNIRLQGLNGALSVCYEGNQLFTVTAGRRDILTLEAQQHPTGAQAGCVYPQTAP